MVISYKVKYTTIPSLSNSTPRYLLKGTKIMSRKNVYENIHGIWDLLEVDIEELSEVT